MLALAYIVNRWTIIAAIVGALILQRFAGWATALTVLGVLLDVFGALKLGSSVVLRYATFFRYVGREAPAPASPLKWWTVSLPYAVAAKWGPADVQQTEAVATEEYEERLLGPAVDHLWIHPPGNWDARERPVAHSVTGTIPGTVTPAAVDARPVSG